MNTTGRSLVSLTIARAVSGPYRARASRRAATLTTSGALLLASAVVAVLAAVAIGCA